MKDTNTGSIDLVLSYGDPDGKAVRAYKFKAKLNFAFVKDDNGKTTLATVGQEDSIEQDVAWQEISS